MSFYTFKRIFTGILICLAISSGVLAENPFSGTDEVLVSDRIETGSSSGSSSSDAGSGGFELPRLFVVAPKASNQVKQNSSTAYSSSSSGSFIKVSTNKSTNTRRIEIKIPNFISQVITFFGGNCPKGTKIVIIIRPRQTVQPVTPKPPSAKPIPNLPVGNVRALKKFMKSNFGINAINGTGAVWTARQLEEANKVLATLPAAFRNSTRNLQRDASYQNNSSVLGYVKIGVPTVHITNAACRDNTFQGTIVHEMTHCFQARYPEIAKKWEKTFWPLGRFLGPWPRSVTSYGNSQPLEDMAESVRIYWQEGARMKKEQPKRYDFIRKYIMSGKEFI